MTLTENAGRFVGQSVARVEDPRLLSGRGRFVDDVQVAASHAAFVRSYAAAGCLLSVDTEAARQLPGVHAVLTAADLSAYRDGMTALVAREGDDLAPPPRTLAEGDVRYVGEPIAIVLAADRYIAEDACDLISVDIEVAEAVVDTAHAATDGTLVHAEIGTNVASRTQRGDATQVDAALRACAHVVSRTFHEARVTNVPMEPRGLIVDYDPVTPQLTIRASTQSIHLLRQIAAAMLGLPEHRVRVECDDVGGAFGQKIYVHRDEACVILAAVHTGRTVKWIEDRQENLVIGNMARGTTATVTMGVDAEGTIVAAKVDLLEDLGADPIGGSAANAPKAAWMFPGPYKIPLVSVSTASVFTNTCGRGSYRGPWSVETTAREQMIDHIARELDLDPIELRLRNVVRPGDLPYTTATGQTYDAVSPLETLKQAVEMVGVEQFRSEQAAARAAGRLLGLGISLFIEPTGGGRGMFATEQATVRISPTGAIQVAMGVTSQGQGVATTMAQVVADALGARLTDIDVVLRDTDVAPYGPGAAGSRNAVTGGAAARLAGQALGERVTSLAAHLLEASPDDIELDGSQASVRGTPTAGLTFAELARVSYTETHRLPPGTEAGLEATVRFTHPATPTWSNACHACICEIDPETGIVALRRYVVSEDCGVMINPSIVEGQIRGGVAQGIGQALLEEMSYDPAGTPTASTFVDYLVPTASDVPAIEIGHIETPARGPGGYKGIGEGGAIGAPAAVANAVCDALRHLSVETTHLPITPPQVLALIEAVPPGARA